VTNPDNMKHGSAMRTQVLGAAYTGAVERAGSPLRKGFDEAETEHVWAALWARPELDLRSRSILTISMLVTQGHGCEEALGLHLKGAVRNKLLTLDEAMELIFHCSIYVGYPKVKAALRVAIEALGTEEASDA